MNPKVSVIIPTHNRSELLRKAIRSVLNQTFTDFELIIIDDGSTDNTSKVVKSFTLKDKRVKYFYQINQGEAIARNTGVEYSSGDYIAFLDDDDEWLPEKLEKQIKLFSTSPFSENLGFVGCDCFFRLEEKIAHNPLPRDWRGNILKKILGASILFPSSLLIKKEAIKGKKFNPEIKTGPDWDMWITIAKEYYFDFVPEPLFYYTIHPNQITRRINLEKFINDCLKIIDHHKNLFKQYPQAYSLQLRYLGSCYCRAGKLSMGRKFFLESILQNPLNFRSYLYFLLSIFGSKIYNLIYEFTKKFRGNKANRLYCRMPSLR